MSFERDSGSADMTSTTTDDGRRVGGDDGAEGNAITDSHKAHQLDLTWQREVVDRSMLRYRVEKHQLADEFEKMAKHMTSPFYAKEERCRPENQAVLKCFKDVGTEDPYNILRCREMLTVFQQCASKATSEFSGYMGALALQARTGRRRDMAE